MMVLAPFFFLPSTQVIAHMMPNLPNCNLERDLESFREFFENPRFRSDGLKIYPTLVIRGTGLYELWKAGLFVNYEPHVLVDLVARIQALVPPWVRIYRIQRDIPMPLVSSGVEKGNLRELSLARMAELGLKCRDVRTREAGIQSLHHQVRYLLLIFRMDNLARSSWDSSRDSGFVEHRSTVAAAQILYKDFVVLCCCCCFGSNFHHERYTSIGYL